MNKKIKPTRFTVSITNYVGVVEGEGKNVNAINDWFEQNNYIGAVSPTNNWVSWINPLR